MKSKIHNMFYKKLSLFCMISIILINCACEGKNDPENGGDDVTVTREGKVMCNQQGIAGVVVTDGNNFTQTDDTGFFSLPYNSLSTHIYISSPSGYTVSVENSVPKFWIRLKDISDKKNINFNLVKMSVSDEKHYFIAVGDPQVRNSQEISELTPIINDISQLITSLGTSPVHLMVTGDVVFNKPLMHDQSKACFNTLNQPVYYAIGNHDHVSNSTESPGVLLDSKADSVFIRHYGPTHYSFNRGEAHYIVLDNIYFEGGADAAYTVNFTQDQLKWLQKDLSYISKDKVLILMFHAPSKSRYSSTYGNSADLHAMLNGYKDVHIICGHTHYNSMMVDNTGITEHIVGAACGGFWEGPICLDGTKLGYKVFEIDGTNIRWIYRAYDDTESQFSVFVPAVRDDILRPDEELLVNVWDWDPTWTVKCSQDNGVSYSDMIRITEKTYDPEAFNYFGSEGAGKVSGRTWIDSSLTDHIFYCVPAAGVTTVIIKVTNHFGEEYTKDIIL